MFFWDGADCVGTTSSSTLLVDRFPTSSCTTSRSTVRREISRLKVNWFVSKLSHLLFHSFCFVWIFITYKNGHESKEMTHLSSFTGFLEGTVFFFVQSIDCFYPIRTNSLANLCRITCLILLDVLIEVLFWTSYLTNHLQWRTRRASFLFMLTLSLISKSLFLK